MNNVYFGLNNVAEKPSKIYVGDSNGVARKVKKAYLGVNGVAKQVYSGDPIDDEWVYTLDGNSLYLVRYIGSATDVTVYSAYTIGGVTYNTKISESPIRSYTGQYMFSNNKRIQSITFENGVDTSYLQKWNGMFSGCTALTNIYGLANLSTAYATDIDFLFYNTLVSDFSSIRNWNTSKVTSMYGVFGKTLATVIDLTNWNTARVTRMQEMFYDSSVEHIYVGSNWNTSGVTGSSNMFYHCTGLPNFNANYIDKTRAYVGSGGYLERKS